jgi:adenine deaminase
VNAFRAKPRQPEDFRVAAQPGKLNVIEAIDGQLVTRWRKLKPTLVGGAAVADPARDLLKIAVVDRYAPRAPAAVGFIRGFGLREGALAASVAHDSHNIVAVGADDEMLAAAVNLVIAHKGGLAAVGQGEAGCCRCRLPG